MCLVSERALGRLSSISASAYPRAFLVAYGRWTHHEHCFPKGLSQFQSQHGVTCHISSTKSPARYCLLLPEIELDSRLGQQQ